MNRRAQGKKIGIGLLAGMALVLTAIVSGCGANKAAPVAKGDARISVSIVRPQKKSVRRELILNGTIRTENEVQVVAETQGKVLRVFSDTGSRVEQGEVLVQIDDELKQSSYATAQAAYDKSKADWNRAQDLFTQKVISDSDRQGVKLAYATAESQLLMARRDFENARVRAPQGGVITQRFVSVGSMLTTGAPVAHIVDTDNLKMTVQVGERDVLKIRKGMSVDIDSDLYPGIVFSGRVSAISPQGDSALTFPVEIALKSDSRKPLYDGMSARAHVNLGERTILAIPRAALAGAYQTPQVYVARDGIARLVSIATGAEYDTDIEVLEGLDEADRIVTEGLNNLNDGASINVAEAVNQ
jgi:membrane fusion protein, multidrug efflux system